jgi:hypothetical protein
VKISGFGLEILSFFSAQRTDIRSDFAIIAFRQSLLTEFPGNFLGISPPTKANPSEPCWISWQRRWIWDKDFLGESDCHCPETADSVNIGGEKN